MEAFLLLLDGKVGVVQVFLNMLAPVFLGNVLGGTVLFSLPAYGQIGQEID